MAQYHDAGSSGKKTVRTNKEKRRAAWTGAVARRNQARASGATVAEAYRAMNSARSARGRYGAAIILHHAGQKDTEARREGRRPRNS